jgi:hypothetical protein
MCQSYSLSVGVDAGHGTQAEDLDGDEEDGYDEGAVSLYRSSFAKLTCPTCQLSSPSTGLLHITMRTRDSLSMMCAKFQTHSHASLINLRADVPRVSSRPAACKLNLDGEPLS